MARLEFPRHFSEKWLMIKNSNFQAIKPVLTHLFGSPMAAGPKAACLRQLIAHMKEHANMRLPGNSAERSPQLKKRAVAMAPTEPSGATN